MCSFFAKGLQKMKRSYRVPTNSAHPSIQSDHLSNDPFSFSTYPSYPSSHSTHSAIHQTFYSDHPTHPLTYPLQTSTHLAPSSNNLTSQLFLPMNTFPYSSYSPVPPFHSSFLLDDLSNIPTRYSIDQRGPPIFQSTQSAFSSSSLPFSSQPPTCSPSTLSFHLTSTHDPSPKQSSFTHADSRIKNNLHQPFDTSSFYSFSSPTPPSFSFTLSSSSSSPPTTSTSVAYHPYFPSNFVSSSSSTLSPISPSTFLSTFSSTSSSTLLRPPVSYIQRPVLSHAFQDQTPPSLHMPPLQQLPSNLSMILSRDYKDRKPPLSYVSLITLAIKSSRIGS